MTRQLHALAPDIEFAWLRHTTFIDDDLVTEVLGADDAPAAEPA